jgi:hypothetical protein
MKCTKIKILILFSLLIGWPTIVFCGNKPYWDVEIPDYPGAKNVIVDRSDKFLSKVKSFDIEIDSPEKIKKFYNEHFESIGWENPLKSFKGDELGMNNGWSAHRMTFNQEGRPEAFYAISWKRKDKPFIGHLQIQLNNYEYNRFSAHVEVRSGPEYDTSPLFELHKLLGNDPKNFFKLYKATKGNPFEIDSIALSCDGDLSQYEPLVKDYCNIVNQILENIEYFRKENGK